MLNQTLAQVTIKLNWILVFFFFMVGCLVMVLNYL